jgi:hypothetical protein
VDTKLEILEILLYYMEIRKEKNIDLLVDMVKKIIK